MSEPEPDDTEPAGVSLADLAIEHGVQIHDTDSRYTEILTATDEVAPIVAAYLLPYERQVIAVRRHEIVLLPAAAAFIGGLAAAISLNSWAYESGAASSTLVRVIWIAWLAAAGWATWQWLDWRYTWFVATSVRLMLITGVLRRAVTPLPLQRVTDLRMHQAAPGRRWGWGTLICESFATDHALHRVSYLPYLQSIFNEIWAMRLPAPGNKQPRIRERSWPE